MHGNISNDTNATTDALDNLIDTASDITLENNTANFSATFQRALDTGDS
jgi:hypothetical protein